MMNSEQHMTALEQDGSATTVPEAPPSSPTELLLSNDGTVPLNRLFDGYCDLQSFGDDPRRDNFYDLLAEDLTKAGLKILHRTMSLDTALHAYQDGTALDNGCVSELRTVLQQHAAALVTVNRTVNDLYDAKRELSLRNLELANMERNVLAEMDNKNLEMHGLRLQIQSLQQQIHQCQRGPGSRKLNRVDVNLFNFSVD